MMERPFSSLAKSPRLAPTAYYVGNSLGEVSGNPTHGLASGRRLFSK
jgi:hypothetical protein